MKQKRMWRWQFFFVGFLFACVSNYDCWNRTKMATFMKAERCKNLIEEQSRMECTQKAKIALKSALNESHCIHIHYSSGMLSNLTNKNHCQWWKSVSMPLISSIMARIMKQQFEGKKTAWNGCVASEYRRKKRRRSHHRYIQK